MEANSNPQSPSRAEHKKAVKKEEPTDVIYNFMNGSFHVASETTISVNDIGLLRGFGVFDYLRTYNHGTPFRLSDHVRRLRHSAEQIGLDLVHSDEKIIRSVLKTLEKNKNHRTGEQQQQHEWGIRLVATGGKSCSNFLPKKGECSLLIMMDPLSVLDPSDDPLHCEGIKISTTRLPNPFPTIKSTNYLGAIMAVQQAVQQGAMDALYVDANEMISECTRSNLFFVKNSVVTTPDNERSTLLEGITRKVVLEILLSKGHGYTLETRPVSLAEALHADEVFCTSTTKEILPVVAIDDVQVGKGYPGSVTQEIHRLFQLYARDSTARAETGEI